jgi:hypothetical protein
MPISPVHDDAIGREAYADRRRGRGSGDRKGWDGTRHKRADSANREDGGSEDVTPNAHDCLHAFTEVNCLDPGSGGPHGHHWPCFFIHQSLADYIS